MKVEWDEKKNLYNQNKHGVSFKNAQQAFEDTNRIIIEDAEHSAKEQRYFCIGKIHQGIVTVRFTYRSVDVVRIIGAGLWRKGRKLYEKKSSLYR